ncbi:MAG: histidinol dehydrogenase [Treponema sp.]|nr:histidinol dehydrogenase [Treponema sp.]
MKIINSAEFDAYQKSMRNIARDESVSAIVNEIISAVRAEGDAAVRRYALRFEKEVPQKFEVPLDLAREAWESLKQAEPELASALSLAADNIRRFAELQKKQFSDFEAEISPGLFTGQRVIPVDRAAIYVPAGRFPLVSSVLMGLIPAAVAGVGEKFLVSPPADDGLPDRRILAAAHLAGADRVFSLGGAQAIAALALGTETVPRADLIVGPGNKYVTEAKRLLYGEVGIDFVAGPTDVLIIAETIEAADLNAEAAELIAQAADLTAADMLAQAEHDPDARARVLAPNRNTAEQIERALEKRLALLSTAETARASLETGGLIIIYKSKEDAINIANKIAPEHLELHVASPEEWISGLRNYGSLFIGCAAAEVLGDYSAGINHTLPTSGSARFTGGLSVRHFLKTLTSLRCADGHACEEALKAAEVIARAEGLAGHAESALARIRLRHGS